MRMHVKDQGSARCLTAEAGPGRTAWCHEMHLESGVRQNHLPVRAQDCISAPLRPEPHSPPGCTASLGSGLLSGTNEALPHRALAKGPGRHLPSFLCSVPGPWGEKGVFLANQKVNAGRW